MANCPKCRKPVADNVGTCPACGQVMPAKSAGTLDAAHFFDADSAKTKEQTGAPEAKVQGSLVPPEPDLKPAAPVAGGTLGAPEIVDATRFAPADAAASGTAALPTYPGGSTQVPVNQTILEGPANSDSIPADVRSTLRMGDQGDLPRSGTINYEEDDEAELTAGKSGSGRSGTAGKLQRLWQGAVGSSQNPMRTLKGAEALASDSVFAKVARRVLVKDPGIDVAESAPSVTESQSDRKSRVHECIQAACQGSEGEKADYDLTGFLGQGGMGVVLKAYQRAIGREVALKMIQPSIGSSTSDTNSQKKKFFYEAQITGKLDHPNIVPIYELGISNDVLFYSMKKIDGKEWRDLLQDKSREDNLDILMKVCDAMAFAHQRQIIHRDLKPENVMIGAFGEVLVTDWGCAIDLASGESFGCAGSPPWMSPEMAEHNRSLIGPRSDVYLLGAMLYQVIAGYPPHPGQTVFECVAAAQKNIIIPLGIQDPLLDIALKAMAKHPDDRYQTVEELQQAIRIYRRNAESITLTERSEALLTLAISSKDYERFSRTIFGFQDAIELWPENTAAKAGLAKARMAYGQCAFAKNDFDLCLSILDRSIPAEKELYSQAEKAKRESEQRVARFKTLRRTFAASVLGLLVILSGVTVFALFQRTEAIAQAKEAEKQTTIAQGQTKEANLQRDNAKAAQKVADQEKEKAVAAASDARVAEFRAQQESRNAILAATRASKEAHYAVKQEAIAVQATGLAKSEANRANEAAEEANTQAASVEFKSAESRLGLALSQIAQGDIPSAMQGLVDVTNTTAEGYPSMFKSAAARLPKFKNWAVNRIELLGNQDLLLKEKLGTVDAVSFAQGANRGVVATRVAAAAGGEETGLLHIVELQEKKLTITRTLTIPAPAAAVNITPNGAEIIYSLVTPKNDVTLFRQRLDDNAPAEQVVKGGSNDAPGLAASAELQSILSSDDKLLTGISRGMWVWARSQGDWSEATPRQIDSVRGRLRSMQLMDAEHALVLVELEGKLYIHNVNLQTTEAKRIVFSPAEDSDYFRTNQFPSAVAFANDRLVIGTESGRLFTVAMTASDLQVGPTFQELLPQQHQSAIRNIHAHQNGTILTAASEPTVQVWRASKEQAGGWRYATSLTGTAGNIGGMDFMANSELVLGVDEEGAAIVWDIQRQQQRMRLTRQDVNGNPLDYDSSVVQVIVGSDNESAVSVHEDGLLDTWSLTSGKTLNQSSLPETAAEFSYIGHSPDATFVDMAIDPSTGILVTCAAMPQAISDEVSKLSDAQEGVTTYEFCKWDLSSRKMLERWQVESAKNQLISLLDSGKHILYAEDNKTLITETKAQGRVHFQNDKLGAYFAVSHPKQRNLAIMVKRSGAARMYDSTLPDGGWNNDNFRIDYEGSDKTLTFGEDIPLEGAWNPSGNRFYMVWESGRITEFAWDNNQLTIKRDLTTPDLDKLNIALRGEKTVSTANNAPAINKKAPAIRLNSRWQLDMKVREVQSLNVLHVLVRFPGTVGRMQLAGLKFPKDDGEVTADKIDYQSEFRMYLTDNETPQLSAEVLKQLPFNAQLVVGARTAGDSAFLATSNGTIYQANREQLVATFGRPNVIAATGDAAAQNIVMLQDNGGLWRASYEAGKWDWNPLAPAPAGAKSLVMSPDGTKLLIRTASGEDAPTVAIVDAATGNAAETLANVRVAKWSVGGDLAMVMNDGQVELRTPAGQTRVLGTIADAAQVQDIHFFVEAWSDDTAYDWLMVQSSAAAGTKLEYLPISELPKNKDGENENAVEDRSINLARNVSVLACSPTEGVFITGGAGSVAVHLASPYLKQYGKSPLFNLEGHAGAELTCIEFSPDGKTLLTTDSKRRLFGWLSADPLGGIDDSRVFAGEKIQ